MIFPNLQSGLFKYTFDEGGCSLFQAILLFLEGLLSFDPQKKIEYEGYEIKELVFLKSLYFESNISANTIKAMLKKLNKPYSYSFKEIYWDFSQQEWKELSQNPEDYIEDNLENVVLDNFDNFLDLVDKDYIEDLAIMRDKIINRIKTIT